MTSHSIRVDAELFDAARAEGALMSRSTAQQVEHWARLGAALEAAGLSVTDVAAMLRQDGAVRGRNEVTEQALWADKRAQQSRDLENVRSGRRSNEQMSWFAGGKAKAAKLANSPY